MAVFSLEIADVDVERVLTAVANNYGWQALVPNPAYVATTVEVPNPEFENYDPEAVDEDGNFIWKDHNGELLPPPPPTITQYIDPVDENGDPIPPQIDNPETMGDFTHRMVRGFLAEHVTSYEQAVARASALDGLNTDVEILDPEVPE